MFQLESAHIRLFVGLIFYVLIKCTHVFQSISLPVLSPGVLRLQTWTKCGRLPDSTEWFQNVLALQLYPIGFPIDTSLGVCSMFWSFSLPPIPLWVLYFMLLLTPLAWNCFECCLSPLTNNSCFHSQNRTCADWCANGSHANLIGRHWRVYMSLCVSVASVCECSKMSRHQVEIYSESLRVQLSNTGLSLSLSRSLSHYFIRSLSLLDTV